MCISWFANQINLRNARCNDKDSGSLFNYRQAFCIYTFRYSHTI